jgi:hypothetical protein
VWEAAIYYSLRALFRFATARKENSVLSPQPVFLSAFLLAAAAFAVFRILVRRDYRQRGRLTLFSSLSVMLIWGLYISFPFLYNPSQWMWFWSPAVPVSPVVRVIGVGCVIDWSLEA